MKRMKKLIGLVAIVGVFGFGTSTLVNSDDADFSLLKLADIASAEAEDAKLCDSIWEVTYTGGTSGVEVSCTSGGEYKCPICVW